MEFVLLTIVAVIGIGVPLISGVLIFSAFRAEIQNIRARRALTRSIRKVTPRR